MATTMLEKIARGAVGTFTAEDLEVAIADLDDKPLAELYEKGDVLTNIAGAHLRARVEALVKHGESQRTIGEVFDVSRMTVQRWCKRWGIARVNGSGGAHNPNGRGGLSQGVTNEHAPGETDEEIDAALEGAGIELPATDHVPPAAVRYLDVRSTVSSAASALEILALKLEKGAAVTNTEADDLLDKVDNLVLRIRTELKGTTA